MRKPILLIAFFIPALTALSQSCLPEGILFSSQAQVDSFQINYPGCSCIEGDVQILGPDISDLNGLEALDSIKGNFTIGHYWNASNPQLQNMDGLENLTYVGGDLVIQHNQSLTSIEGFSGLNKIRNELNISGNPLSNLAGLEGIDTIHSDLYIWGNDELSDLTGLNNVRCIEGDINLWSNENLHYLTGLENLDRVGESIIIDGSDGLYNFSGLNNLHTAGFLLISSSSVSSLSGLENLDTLYNGLSIQYCYWLTSLDGLSGLIYNGGGMNLEMNQDLSSIEGLSALTHLGGELRVVWNTALTSLSGLENIDPGSISNIWIYLNQNLSECDITSLCNYLASPNGSVSIFSNDTGCNSPSEIADGCNITLSCLPYGNYHFTCQADVDDFPVHYPGCSNLQGEVWIEGDDIFGLDSLSGIDTIHGDLYICWNPDLSSLMGLHNLKVITGDLNLGYWEHGGNAALTDLAGLNGLSSVGDYMLILGNSGLTSLSGLDSLEYVGERLEIIENHSLTSMAGLGHLNALRSITINGNDSLLNLDGLQGLINVDECIEVKYNPMLTTLNGIEHIFADSLDFIRVQYNDSLSECNVKSVCDFLNIPESRTYIDHNAPGCNSREEVEATCEVGLEEIHLQKGKFLLYPNPATKEIIIEIQEDQDYAEVSVLNLHGQEIIRQYISDRITKVDISDLSSGIYFVRLKGDKGVAVQKFMKLVR